MMWQWRLCSLWLLRQSLLTAQHSLALPKSAMAMGLLCPVGCLLFLALREAKDALQRAAVRLAHT